MISRSVLLALLPILLLVAACNPTNPDPYAGRGHVFAATLPELGGIDYARNDYTLHALPETDPEVELASTNVGSDGSFALHLPKNPPQSLLADASTVFGCDDPTFAGTRALPLNAFELRDAEGTPRYLLLLIENTTPTEARAGAFVYLTEPLDTITTCGTPSQPETTITYDFDTTTGWMPLAETGISDPTTGMLDAVHFETYDDPTAFADWFTAPIPTP